MDAGEADAVIGVRCPADDRVRIVRDGGSYPIVQAALSTPLRASVSVDGAYIRWVRVPGLDESRK